MTTLPEFLQYCRSIKKVNRRAYCIIFPAFSYHTFLFFGFIFILGRPARTATATLLVDVKDINDNAPSFRDFYRPVVMENVDPPIKVIELFAEDPDVPPPTKPWFKFQLDPNAPSVIKESFRVVFNRGRIFCLLEYKQVRYSLFH